MGSWTNIAALLSAKTKEGGLSVKPTEGLPFLLTEGLEVTFVPPLLRFPRSAKVARVEHPSSDRYLVYFEGIDTRNDAELLEGHFCLVRTSDLPEGFELADERALVGYIVVDALRGTVGKVIRMEENPAHPLLVVLPEVGSGSAEDDDGKVLPSKSDMTDSANREVLIPLVDAFIRDVDEEAGILHVSLPDGLLDL